MVRRFIRRQEKGEPGMQPGPTKAAEEARIKILEMLEKGRITADQALKLLEAVDPKPPTPVGFAVGPTAFTFTTDVETDVEQMPESDEMTKTIPAEGIESVRVENPNGKILVAGWDKPEVHVVARRTGGDRLHAGIAIRHEDGVLVIKPGNPNPDRGHGFFGFGMADRAHRAVVMLEVHVPSGMDTKVWSSNGTISAEGLARSTRMSTTNGTIYCKDLSGMLKAGTTNGTIDARGLSTHQTQIKTVNGHATVAMTATPKGECSAGTVNGGITFYLPENPSLTITAHTVNGSVHSEFPITTHTMSRKKMEGTIGNGDLAMTAKTVNGAISLRKLADLPERSEIKDAPDRGCQEVMDIRIDIDPDEIRDQVRGAMTEAREQLREARRQIREHRHGAWDDDDE